MLEMHEAVKNRTFRKKVDLPSFVVAGNWNCLYAPSKTISEKRKKRKEPNAPIEIREVKEETAQEMKERGGKQRTAALQRGSDATIYFIIKRTRKDRQKENLTKSPV